MRKRLKKAILLLLAALASLLVFAGCELGMTKEQAINALEARASVTYYANGGEIGSLKSSELFYKANSRPANIANGASSGTLKGLNRNHYDFVDWYHVQVDENGKPKANIDTGLCELDMNRPVDFSVKLQEGDAWFIGVLWKQHKHLDIVLASESPVTDESGITYNSGDEIGTVYYSKKIADLADDDAPILVANREDSFISYYYDVDCTQLIMGEIAETDDWERKIYAKYIDGDWVPLRTANDVQAMFVRSEMKDKYFLVRDIDMTGKSVAVYTVNTGAGVRVLNGNGYKISNMILESSALNKQCSFFGQIQKGSNIKDVTFENVTFDLKLTNVFNSSFGIYFVFTSIDNEVTVENVNFTGTISMVIEKSETVTIANLPKVEEKYNLDNCLFGGYDTDTAYIQNAPNGFKVDGIVTIEDKKEK